MNYLYLQYQEFEVLDIKCSSHTTYISVKRALGVSLSIL